MADPAKPLSPDALLSERKAALEQLARAKGQPTSLDAWRALLGELPPAEEGEGSLEDFDRAIEHVRKSAPVPSR